MEISKQSPGITLLGLGPGDASLLTREAWDVLESLPEITVRTRQHPAIAGMPPNLQVRSFDELYEGGESFEAVYEEIVRRVLELGRRPEGVVYGVPGHPFIAEATGPEIARRARAEGLPVRVIGGMSFLEPVFTALELDPFPNTALVDALELAAAHVPNFPPSASALVAQLYSKAVASDVKLTLMSVYPDEFTVRLVHAAGTADEEVEELPLHAIDQSERISLLTALYVPPLGNATSFEAFQEVVAHLRAPDGCPWDREQTHRSMRSDLLEEAYEVLTALDSEDPQALQEELGDLLLHIVMHAQIASEEGEFGMADVLQGINTKLVHRHPHVFEGLEVEGTHSVLANWERLKAEERAANGKAEASLLDGIAHALPALVQAMHFQKRVARVGFDWPDIQGVWDKVGEEIVEVRDAETAEERTQEVGDLLFAVVNLARWLKVDPESALRESNARFRERFAYIEASAREQGRSAADLSMDEMDRLWEAAKKR